jgi:hypothetical protein
MPPPNTDLVPPGDLRKRLAAALTPTVVELLALHIDEAPEGIARAMGLLARGERIEGADVTRVLIQSNLTDRFMDLFETARVLSLAHAAETVVLREPVSGATLPLEPGCEWPLLDVISRLFKYARNEAPAAPAGATCCAPSNLDERKKLAAAFGREP